MTLFEENTQILRNIAESGCPLTEPRAVDFAHVFYRFAGAEAFVADMIQRGFRAEVNERDDEDVKPKVAEWDVIVSTVMIPTCEAITSTEEELTALAQPYGGRPDGWGFWEA
ncbi:MAG: ribonuclease E inhibitor RraB [Asticcacaulis sp.]|nr:ribonuclease E inhibitor RraB [Asticcacaulis sp.]